MKRSFVTFLSLLILASMVLTACGSGAAPAEEAPAAEAPAAEAEAEDEAVRGAEELVIGFTSSLTGKYEVSSKRQVNGFTLWMDQVNDAGGLTLSDGTVVTFNYHTYDDESNAERVQELYTRLVNEDEADFLISPYSSGLTSAASIVAEQSGKILLTTGAADDATYKTGNTSLFQLYTPASLYMSSTVDMLKELNPDAKVALVHESDKFSTGVAEGIRPYLEANGFEIVLEEDMPLIPQTSARSSTRSLAPAQPYCSVVATTTTAQRWLVRSMGIPNF